MTSTNAPASTNTEAAHIWSELTTAGKFTVTSIVAVICGIIYLLAVSTTEYEDRLAAAQSIADPWNKFQKLMEGRSPNALLLTGSESHDEINWNQTAKAALVEALKLNSRGALDYVCRQYIDYEIFKEYSEQYCPSTGLSKGLHLLNLAQTDARYQGLPEPTGAFVAETAQKHGGKYTPDAWVFPSIEDRRAFEKDLTPSRN